jgi:hypothetical protein
MNMELLIIEKRQICDFHIARQTGALLVTLIAFLGLTNTSQAQEEPYVELHSVRILYNDQVELSFSTNIDNCYMILNQADESRNAGVICGQEGDNTLIRDRNLFFPRLVMSDVLHFQTTIFPVIQSNVVSIGGLFELHSVTLQGNQVVIDYTKSFRECAVMVRDDGELLNEDATSLCQEGEHVTRIVSRDLRFSELALGDEVKLRLIEQPGFETEFVTVTEPSTPQSCVMARDGVELADRAEVIAPQVYSDAVIRLNHNARIFGDVLGRDDLWSQASAIVDGNVFLSGTLSNQSPDISGDLNENVAVPAEQPPSVSVNPGAQDQIAGNDAALFLAPGSYDQVQIGDRSTIVFEAAGTYAMNTLVLGNDSTIEVETSFGNIFVEVRSQLQFGDRLKMHEIDDPFAPSVASHVFFSTESNYVRVPNSTQIRGSIVAPNAYVELGDRGELVGCVSARQLRLNNDATVFAF